MADSLLNVADLIKCTPQVNHICTCWSMCWICICHKFRWYGFSNILKYHRQKPTKTTAKDPWTIPMPAMMPFVSVWLMLACLWQIQSSQGHPSDLHNVAYNKRVTVSSKHPHHGGSKAVNGLFDDFATTDRERSPWLRIDLGRNYHIHEIEVFARRDCPHCGKFIWWQFQWVLTSRIKPDKSMSLVKVLFKNFFVLIEMTFCLTCTYILSSE